MSWPEHCSSDGLLCWEPGLRLLKTQCFALLTCVQKVRMALLCLSPPPVSAVSPSCLLNAASIHLPVFLPILEFDTRTGSTSCQEPPPCFPSLTHFGFSEGQSLNLSKLHTCLHPFSMSQVTQSGIMKSLWASSTSDKNHQGQPLKEKRAEPTLLFWPFDSPKLTSWTLLAKDLFVSSIQCINLKENVVTCWKFLTFFIKVGICEIPSHVSFF